MSAAARLLVPAIRWDRDTRFEGQRSAIERSLELGCGGYIIFGGEASAVRELAHELRERTSFPLLIASDLERGAGQQFSGATGLPPLAAIGATGEEGAAARAARITAREALALGVNWVLAPVCDLDLEQANPIVGTRSLGSDPAKVSALVAEWVDSCQAAGAMACAKHFPGHGRTAVDSHALLPSVDASADELRNVDLAPFRAAIDAGVASVLTAHVSYPSLQPGASEPATLSRAIITDLLRTELRFDGIIVTDAMIMEGVLRGRDERGSCVAALAAGCDLVLYPTDVPAVAAAIESAMVRGELDGEQLRMSMNRRDRWSIWCGARTADATTVEREWAADFALSCVHEVRGHLHALSRRIDLLLVDDDLGGPWPPPSREPLRDALLNLGVDARWVEAPTGDASRSLVVALFGDIRSWKGRAGYAAETLATLARIVAGNPEAIVLQFSHPRLAGQLSPDARSVVSAWGGEKVMQQAGAQWLRDLVIE